MVNQLADLLVKYRAWFSLLSLLLVISLGAGLASLRFESDYKIFFSDDNPQLLAHELNQETYTKSDNITFVIAPQDEVVFTKKTLQSIQQLTKAAWKMPYSSRVDSVTNYQHTWVEEDDLIVEDLVLDLDSLTLNRLNELKDIVLLEPQLVNNLISNRAHATGVSVNLNLPDLRAEADKATVEVVAYARKLRDQIEAENPNLKIYLIGQTIVNNTFNEMSTKDMTQLLSLIHI